MSLDPGSSLGPYEIVGPLGAGGMGEVYRARDPRLGREVAVKVLPDSFSSDAEWSARFEREARLLASLNHPNVAAVYGFEKHGPAHCLIMELVEGETLAERLQRGRLEPDEAFPLFEQIADGLAAAHDGGVVHRDLKPANIKITPEGKAKVLDFGLAKTVMGADGSSVSLSMSPTMTALGTQAGTILGTAAYMSPEQARGKPVDRRTDVWAFGCVLFEALSGTAVFPGETVTDILAAIVRAEPAWEELPDGLPRPARRLLRRCLEKDPARRLRDLGDARLEIVEAMAGGTQSDGTSVQAAPASRSVRVPWILSAALTIALIAVAVTLGPGRSTESQPVRRLSLLFPQELGIDLRDSVGVAISPDARRVAVLGSVEGASRLFIREMDQVEPIEFRIGSDVADPAFSPDGRWIAFFSDQSLRKAEVSAGSASTFLAEATSITRGLAWGPDDTIVFCPDTTGALSRVPAAGGPVQQLTTLDKTERERTHRWPSFVPGGEWVLFTVGSLSSPEFYDDGNIDAVSLRTGERHTVLTGSSMAIATTNGQLIHARGGNLFATPFDPTTARTSGSPVLVQEAVDTRIQSGAVRFAIADDGTLALIHGTATTAPNRLAWIERAGDLVPLEIEPAPIYQPALSPNGRQVALFSNSGRTNDIRIYDLERGTLNRMTFEGGNVNPVWSPDGKQIAFGSSRGGGNGVFVTAADGSTESRSILETDRLSLPNAWHPDGSLLVVDHAGDNGNADLVVLPLDGGESYPLLNTEHDEFGAAFSPDGRWYAHVSDESGRHEIYVRPFPGPGGRWQISSNGGIEPLFSADGSEIFYLEEDKIIAVPLEVEGSAVRAGPPEIVFEGNFIRSVFDTSYSVTPDGKRFLVIVPLQDATQNTEVRIVFNWFEELRRRTGQGGGS